MWINQFENEMQRMRLDEQENSNLIKYIQYWKMAKFLALKETLNNNEFQLNYIFRKRRESPL